MLTVMLTLDGSAWAEQALPQALALCPPAQQLLLVRVVDPDASWNYVESHLGDQELEAAHAYLDKLAHDLPVPVRKIVCTGSPREQIPATAYNQNADLIVMASHGRTGLSRWVMGSVAESVAREAPCPVWLVRSQSQTPPAVSRVLVTLDSSESAERALHFLPVWLSPTQTHLTLMGAVHPDQVPQARELLEKRAELLRQEGWNADTRVETSSPAAAIIDAATGFDLIVISSRGRGSSRWRLLGSVAEQVARHAPCPVALVHERADYGSLSESGHHRFA